MKNTYKKNTSAHLGDSSSLCFMFYVLGILCMQYEYCFKNKIIENQKYRKAQIFKNFVKIYFEIRIVLKEQPYRGVTECDKCKYLNYWLFDHVLTYKTTYESILPLIRKWDEQKRLNKWMHLTVH
ncbi:hypothetical protein AK88_05234 [Plasmodium fragile]|uniref:Uncharacterized protein n=1 Tax=Plasmodium fragile TaxID=5857 RepID=A0A0D9QEB3_PLAFR|nr:uncharacterized protein AK88_05234 [Plasmodium fragile]KJP85137.1 hypothetical protein AK88_05234 [Plasmodium fragile]